MALISSRSRVPRDLLTLGGGIRAKIQNGGQVEPFIRRDTVRFCPGVSANDGYIRNTIFRSSLLGTFISGAWVSELLDTMTISFDRAKRP